MRSEHAITNIHYHYSQNIQMTIIKIADALEVDPKDFFSEKIKSENKQQLKDRIINLLEQL
jgi:hypothetical protein